MKRNIVFYVSLAIIILTTLYFVIKNSQSTPNKEDSVKRMNNLKKVLISIFGDNWQVIMLILSILLIFILILLHIISKKNNSINVGDKASNILSYTFASAIFVFCIYVIVIFIKTVREKSKDDDNTDYLYNKNYQDATNNMIVITIVSIFICIGLYFLTKWTINKFKKS